MLGIYLIVSILAQITPQTVWLSPQNGPTEVVVQFQKANSLKIGTPVLVEGQLIGTVSELAEAGESAISDGNNGSSIKVKIAPKHQFVLKEGTVALISSPLSVARLNPEKVVELIPPIKEDAASLKDGQSINGYSSYEEFWSAGSAKHFSL